MQFKEAVGDFSVGYRLKGQTDLIGVACVLSYYSGLSKEESVKIIELMK